MAGKSYELAGILGRRYRANYTALKAITAVEIARQFGVSRTLASRAKTIALLAYRDPPSWRRFYPQIYYVGIDIPQI